MYNNYEDACEATLTLSAALREVRAHGLDPDDFKREVGTKDRYKGSEVLDWLGY